MNVMCRACEPITGRTCRARLDYQTRDGEEPIYKTVTVILAGCSQAARPARAAADRLPASAP